MPNPAIKNVIFDFDGVLLDWDARYFYKEYFHDDEKTEYFLTHIATEEWNGEQDRGRTLKEGTEALIKQYPEWEKEIKAYYENWDKMIKSDIPQNVEILRKLAKTSYKLFGLTNWSNETIQWAYDRYDFFQLFEGKIVVSGDEKLIKPDPAIWNVLLDRYHLQANESVFIDDNHANIAAAKKNEILYCPSSKKTLTLARNYLS